MVEFLDVFCSEEVDEWGGDFVMVPVVETIMSNIMGKGSNDNRDCVKFGELGNLFHVLWLKHKTNVLSRVWTMKIIVILDSLVVSSVDLIREANELPKVDTLIKPMNLEQSHSNCWENLVSSNHFLQVKNVEIEGAQLIEELIIIDEFKVFKSNEIIRVGLNLVELKTLDSRVNIVW